MSTTLEGIRQSLAAYGVTLIGNYWSVAEAEIVRQVVIEMAQRLYDFALLIYDNTRVGDQFTPFNLVFNPLKFNRIPQDTLPNSNIWGLNIGQEIQLFNKAFFNGEKSLRRQPPNAEFKTTFTTKFLITHEICHSRKIARVYPRESSDSIDRYYVATSSDIVDLLVNNLGGAANDYNPNNNITTANAGYQQAARSVAVPAEFSTDGLANWYANSFANNEYGETRKRQMNEMMSKLLYAVYGLPTIHGQLPTSSSSNRPTFTLRGVHGENAANWLLNNSIPGWAVETIFSGTNFTTPQPQDFSTHAAANVRVLLRLSYSFATSDGGTGTYPVSSNYGAFADWCVQTIRQSQGVWGYIIGNEPNNATEQPDSNVISPEDVASIFNAVRDQLPEAQYRLSPAAIDPTTAITGIDPRDYWRRVLHNLHRADFFALHAYSYSSDQPVNSDERFLTMPWQYYSFKMWRPLASVIYREFPEWRRVPLVITEANHLYLRGTNPQQAGWDNDNVGAQWIRDVYDSVASWNRALGSQYVHGVCLYRYEAANDPRTLINKTLLLDALQQSGTPPT